MSHFHSFVEILGKYKYVVVLLIIILIVGFVDENSYWNRHARNIEIQKLREEISLYQNQYDEDTRKLKALDKYENVERLAREKYLMKRDDEDVFIIQYELDEDSVSSSDDVQE